VVHTSGYFILQVLGYTQLEKMSMEIGRLKVTQRRFI